MSQKKMGKAGVVVPPSDNSMDQLASSVLDDLLYNVVRDLLIKTHRDEKQARAATAAINVETLAAEDAQDLAGATGESRPGGGRYETEAATYENGIVMLKSNPLTTTHDILCPRCHLPRLLYPTDGRGARKPDPAVTYCKKHPYIDKPGCDIYGQMWVAPGPGRGKKKKDFEKKINAAIHAATTDIEGANGGGGTEQRPPNVLSFPSATCSKCKRCILVSRLNNHMGSCIGNSGRNASRAAAAKISNGANGGGSGSSHHGTLSDHTPPSSQKGTPLPSSQGASPRKRDADDFDDGDEDSDAGGGHGSKPKKKFKVSDSASSTVTVSTAGLSSGGTNTPSGGSSSSQGLSAALSKRLTLKMKGGGAASAATGSAAAGGKKQKAKPSSALSFERKPDDDDGASSIYVDGRDDDDQDDGAGDDNDRSQSHGGRSLSVATTTSTTPTASKTKKMRAESSTPTPTKKTTKVPIPIPGKKVKLVNKTPLSPPASKSGYRRDMDVDSESSETMSSPRS